MCKASDGMFSILAIYDICRSDIKNFKGLDARRGVDDIVLESGPHVNYVAISGTDPRGTVAAASKLAVLLFIECDKAAANHKYGLVQIPHVWIDFNGEDGLVEKTIMGKSYFLPWGESATADSDEEEKDDIYWK